MRSRRFGPRFRPEGRTLTFGQVRSLLILLKNWAEPNFGSIRSHQADVILALSAYVFGLIKSSSFAQSWS